jgi:DNA-directed RNA polymerase subunit K/omega
MAKRVRQISNRNPTNIDHFESNQTYEDQKSVNELSLGTVPISNIDYLESDSFSSTSITTNSQIDLAMYTFEGINEAKINFEVQTSRAKPFVTTREENLMTPIERISAELELDRGRRETLREKYGDPLDALANILSDLSDETLEQHFEPGDNGIIYVKRLED